MDKLIAQFHYRVRDDPKLPFWHKDPVNAVCTKQKSPCWSPGLSLHDLNWMDKVQRNHTVCQWEKERVREKQGQMNMAVITGNNSSQAHVYRFITFNNPSFSSLPLFITFLYFSAHLRPAANCFSRRLADSVKQRYKLI